MNRSTAFAAAFAALALSACGGSSKSSPPPPPPPPPPVVVTTFQAASTLIGQPDWTTAPAPSLCTASSLENPFGPVAWNGTDLLVPDTDSGRLLGFSPFPPAYAGSAASATFAIGQNGLTSCNANAAVGFLQAPSVSGTKLVLSDSGYMQVYLWNTFPASWDTAADSVFGDSTTDCTSTGLNDPRGAIVVGSDLVIADSQHNRVLVFALTDASKPRLVLGQVEGTCGGGTNAGEACKIVADCPDPTGTCTPGFDRCVANDGIGTGFAPTAATLNRPTAVWSNGTKLAVADTDNHRVLLWKTFPTASGQAADVVIGQSSFTTIASGAGAAGLNSPQSIASDGDQLFVADTGNNRVLAYATIPTANGASATIVLGQGDFTHVAANDDLQTGTAGSGRTARTLSAPNGVAVVDGLLAVTDTGNSRVVVYRPPSP